jgi:hypothetical protein
MSEHTKNIIKKLNVSGLRKKKAGLKKPAFLIILYKFQYSSSLKKKSSLLG